MRRFGWTPARGSSLEHNAPERDGRAKTFPDPAQAPRLIPNPAARAVIVPIGNPFAFPDSTELRVPRVTPSVSSMPRRRRGPAWRQWLLVFALATFLSVLSTALTHFHKNASEDLDCPICHVFGHQGLDCPNPDVSISAGLVLWFILSCLILSAGVISVSPERRPPSRAPPRFGML